MKSSSVKFSIRWKLLTTMTCLVVSVLAVSTYLQIASQKQIFDRELELRITLIKEKLISRGRTLSGNLSAQVQNGLATVNLSHISEVLKKAVIEDSELHYAVLVDSSGRAYIHTLKPELELEILTGQENQAIHQQQFSVYEHSYYGLPVIEFIVPIQISTEPWGVLRLGFTLDTLHQEMIRFKKDNALKIQRMIKHSVYAASAFIAITAVIILILSDRLSRPLRRLTRAVNKMAAGDFAVTDTFKVNSSDEIGVLSTAFINMSKDLSTSYLKLQNYNLTLEHKVKERTSELAEARDEAVKANQSKSDFLSMISHEIRTPMNAIIGMTQLSLNTDLSNKQHDYLTKVKSSADSLMVIINDLLDTSKIEAGQLGIETVNFNLEDVLIHLTNIVGIKAEEKNLDLHFSIADDVPYCLLGDPLRLGQILLNLVGNAIKFTESGDIIVKIELVNEYPKDDTKLMLKFSVKDSGIGLSLKQIDGLFKPFSQADTSTSRLYGGTGLGLAISKQLVNLMGGTIVVESEPGVGSDFIFTVCLNRSDNSGSAKSTIAPKKYQGMKVLVVDDNAAARDILKTYLESFSFNVSLACSGEEAINELENARENPYSLVLMDWKMPKMDGIKTAQIIKENNKIISMPTIIMVTAHAKEDVLPQVKKLGLAGVLIKPVNPSYLFQSVINTLQPGIQIDHKANNSFENQSDIKVAPIFNNCKILVVDDHSINQDVAKALLENEGFYISSANNGQQAIQMINEAQFDAVLMDLQMPGLDGYDTTRLIRSQCHFSDLPIIALTAHATEKERIKCISQGMQDCVSKPIDMEQLLFTLNKYIKPKEVEYPDNCCVEQNKTNKGKKNKKQLSEQELNEQLYLKLITEFELQFSDVLKRVRNSLQTDDKILAQQLTHGLKGVSGNIAAVELTDKTEGLETAFNALADRADELETALNSQQDDFVIPIEQCEQALQQVLSGIKAYNKNHIIELDQSRAQDFEQASMELSKLTELLKLSSLDVDLCFDAFKNCLSSSDFADEIIKLDHCISIYDFKKALLIAQEIAQGLPKVPVDHTIMADDMDDKPRILIVDDMPLNIKVLAQALRKKYAIQIAHNGDDAVFISTSSQQPDLVLLDIEMPDMNGYELCLKLKKNKSTQKIPVIFITGRTTAADEKIGLEMGAVDYITKPFNIAVAQARVNTHIELKRHSDLLEQLACLDGLTGIPNRRRFDEVLEQEWLRTRRSQKPLSIIFIDVDFFKKFNDFYGHSAGDQCLCVIAKTLKGCIKRNSDFIGRYGGEEFVAILPETDAQAAFSLAESMRVNVENLKIPHTPEKGFYSVTLSLGVATVVPKNGMVAIDLVNTADEAVYQAKSNGRNQVKQQL